jgi:hypothetical protein
MTTYYLSSVDGDNGSDGLSWANAWATFEYAIETASAAASGPHTVLIDSAHSESLSADTTVTAAADINIFSVNRTTGALEAGAVVGAQASNYAVTVNGAWDVYIYGMTIRNGTNTTSSRNITINSSDGGHFELESCSLLSNTLGSTNTSIVLGSGGSVANAYTRLKSCTLQLSNAGGTIACASRVELEGCDVTAATVAVNNLFKCQFSSANASLLVMGCDLSEVTTTLVANSGATGGFSVVMGNCKLGSGVLPMEAATEIFNKGNTSVELFNCSAGDTHYGYYHGDDFGSTTAVVTYYADDGAVDQNSINISYKVVTTAYCRFETPYVGPWIAKPHTGTSTVTPSFEGLRVDSATVIQDDEVWGEWSYQGTSGFTLASFVNDRMTPLGTAANQTSAKTYADWTGSPTDTDANDSVFKLAPAAITPAEVGHIMGRVVVGEPELTIYYDPQIRVA